MTELYDAEHNKVEGALTPEEVEEKLKTEVEKAKTEASTQVDTIKSDYEKQIKEKDDKIEEQRIKMEDYGKKDFNWKQAQDVIETLKKEKAEIERKMDEKITKVKDELRGDTLVKAIKRVAGDDKDLQVKVKYHYDRIKGEPANEDEIMERVEEAYLLATGSKPRGGFSSDAFRTGGGAGPKGGETGGKVSEEGSEVGEKLGVDKETQKKHKLI